MQFKISRFQNHKALKLHIFKISSFRNCKLSKFQLPKRLTRAIPKHSRFLKSWDFRKQYFSTRTCIVWSNSVSPKSRIIVFGGSWTCPLGSENHEHEELLIFFGKWVNHYQSNMKHNLWSFWAIQTVKFKVVEGQHPFLSYFQSGELHLMIEGELNPLWFRFHGPRF